MRLRQGVLFVALLVAGMSAAQAQTCAASRLNNSGIPLFGNRDMNNPIVTIYADSATRAASQSTAIKNSATTAGANWTAACPRSSFPNIPSFTVDWTKDRPNNFPDVETRNRSAMVITILDQSAPADKVHKGAYIFAQWGAVPADMGAIVIYAKCPGGGKVPEFGCTNGSATQLINWASAGGIAAIEHEIGHGMGLDHERSQDGAGHTCPASIMSAFDETGAGITQDECVVADRVNDADALCVQQGPMPDGHSPCDLRPVLPPPPPPSSSNGPGQGPFGADAPWVGPANWIQCNWYVVNTTGADGSLVCQGSQWLCTTSVLAGTPQTTFVAGPPVAIDTPANGQTVHGSVLVSGWAMDFFKLTGISFGIDRQQIASSNLQFGFPQPEACQPPAGIPHSACNPNSGYSGTIDVSQLSNGPHTLQIIATGHSGFPTEAVRTINVCNSAPTLSLVTPAPGATVTGVTSVSVSATDSVAVGQVSLYVDGLVVARSSSTPFQLSWDTTGLTPGSHVVRASLVDTCGNTAATNPITVQVQPVIRMFIDQPAEGSTVSNTASLIGWATDGAGITTLGFQLDGQPLAATLTYGTSRADVCSAYPGDPHCPNVGWNAAIPTTSFSNGSHVITVTATDAVGQRAVAVRNLVFSNATAPAVVPTTTITTPAQGALLSGNPSVVAVASSGAAITRMEAYVDGVLRFSSTGSPLSFNWLTGNVADGSHTLQSKVFDALSRTATSPLISVTVDNTAPLFVMTAPVAGGTLSGTAARVAGWATDATGVRALSFRLDGQPIPTLGAVTWLDRGDLCSAHPTGDANCPNIGWRTLFDSTGYSNGPHTLQVTATDGAGNSAVLSVSVTISN